MIHMLASALAACVLIPAEAQVTSVTASKDTRVILIFLMDAKISMSVLPTNLHAPAASTYLEVSLVHREDP